MKPGIQLKYYDETSGTKITMTLSSDSDVMDMLESFKGFMLAIGYQVEGELVFQDEVDDFYENVHRATVKELESQISTLTEELSKYKEMRVINSQEITAFLDELERQKNCETNCCGTCS